MGFGNRKRDCRGDCLKYFILTTQDSHKRFSKIIRCNIGDCHASGQKPIKFIRDVLAAATNTAVMESNLVPDDAKLRAKRFLESCGGSVGVYSQSTGVQIVREDVANYIECRDQLEANPEDIFLSTGASEAVKVSTGSQKLLFLEFCHVITLFIWLSDSFTSYESVIPL
ncbi:unnamed protein product [Trichobilharzia regenti]|nr:unnamed protein product [Trichobilharzia regenti]